MLSHRIIYTIFLTLLAQGNVTSALPLGPKVYDRGEHIYGRDAAKIEEEERPLEERSLEEVFAQIFSRHPVATATTEALTGALQATTTAITQLQSVATSGDACSMEMAKLIREAHQWLGHQEAMQQSTTYFLTNDVSRWFTLLAGLMGLLTLPHFFAPVGTSLVNYVKKKFNVNVPGPTGAVEMTEDDKFKATLLTKSCPGFLKSMNELAKKNGKDMNPLDIALAVSDAIGDEIKGLEKQGMKPSTAPKPDEKKKQPIIKMNDLLVELAAILRGGSKKDISDYVPALKPKKDGDKPKSDTPAPPARKPNKLQKKPPAPGPNNEANRANRQKKKDRKKAQKQANADADANGNEPNQGGS